MAYQKCATVVIYLLKDKYIYCYIKQCLQKEEKEEKVEK